MSKPEKIKIRNVSYDFVYGNLPCIAGKNLYACIDFQGKKIYVQVDGREGPEVLRSVIHEVLHAVGHEYHLSWLNGIGNNMKVDMLAAALVETIVDNGIKFVTEGDNVR